MAVIRRYYTGTEASPLAIGSYFCDLESELPTTSEVVRGVRAYSADTNKQWLCTAVGPVVWSQLYPALGVVLLQAEHDLSLNNKPAYSGTFNIMGTGFDIGKPVVIQQAAGPYTGKGTLEDEAEMDLVIATARVISSTTIRVFWTAQVALGPIAGNIKFQYAVSP